MFAIAKTAPSPVEVQTPAGTATITVSFRWLRQSERIALVENRDKEARALEAAAEDGAALSPEDIGRRTQDFALVNARLLVAIADGWDLKYTDGRDVPWTVAAVAEVLDYMPNLFWLLLTASATATSVEAVQKN